MIAPSCRTYAKFRRLCQVAALGALFLAPPAFAAEPAAAPSCTSALAEPVCIGATDYVPEVCAAIGALALHYGLPEAFFARLIWQESRFDPRAISPAGAQGIAQFMPGTARLRQVADPFDPATALQGSAAYLQALETKFGNWGLAAAAYNGGEARITRFVAGIGGVPRETRDYVAIITGLPIESWTLPTPPEVEWTLQPETLFQPACIEMAKAVPMPDLEHTFGVWQPWGVLLAQNASSSLAQARFARAQRQFDAVLGEEAMLLITVRNPSFGPRTRFSAQVGRPTLAQAQELCDALLQAGGNCIVQKNE